MIAHIWRAAFSLIIATLFSTPSLAAHCDKNIGDYWVSGTYEIKGEKYWLSKVFTIDRDNDKHTDNIGFRLTGPEGKTLVLFYFAPKGGLSGRSMAPFKLSDETVIPTLCFEQISFELPLENYRSSEFPDLSAEIGKKIHGNEQKPAVADSTHTIWIGIIFGVPLGLLVGGLVAYLMVRMRRRGDDDGDEDDEEDDDGDFAPR